MTRFGWGDADLHPRAADLYRYDQPFEKEATMPARRNRKPNIILLGIDSLRRDHMSGYGYHRLTTPHIDRFAKEACSSSRPSAPTSRPRAPTPRCSPGRMSSRRRWSRCVTKARCAAEVKTLAEILREEGYDTTCVGFTGNPSARGFDKYIEFPGWGSWNEGRSPKAQNLNEVALPELDRLARKRDPFFLFLRHMDPHSPYLPPAPFERMFYHGNEFDKRNKSMEPVMAFKPFRDFFASWMPPGVTDKEYIIAQYDGAVAYMDAAIRSIFTALEARGLAEETHRRHQRRPRRDALRPRLLL
jgi:arylsulfatase A-like enzyme